MNFTLPTGRRYPAKRTLQSVQEQSDTSRRRRVFMWKLAEVEPAFPGCQWIEGTPSKADYRIYGADRFKCLAPAKPDSPYCEAHHARAYTKVLTKDVE